MRTGRLAHSLDWLRAGVAVAFAVGMAIAQPRDDYPRIAYYGQAIFFPPSVPVFGEALADEPSIARAPWIPPRPELADFVNEFFYPALGTRLFDDALGRKLEQRLDAYRSTRSALLNELADQLTTLQDADPVKRRVDLRAFAADQNPRIHAFEAEGEQLRQALVDGRIIDRRADWNRGRKWTLGVTKFPNDAYEREAEFQIVRAAAFAQDGLLTEQRGLLIELASELRSRARASRPLPPPKTDDASAMFFSPATARMRLPSKLPPELVTLIGRFNSEKAALKRELREAVIAGDKLTPEERLQAFSTLAESQWPRLAPLEALAEEIRVALAALPVPRLAAPPHVPPALLARIKQYMSDRQAFIRDFNQAQKAATELVPPPPPDGKLSADERVQLARQRNEERAALRERVAQQFQIHTRERFERMRGEFEQIQISLKLVAAAQFDSETGKPLNPDTLLRVYSIAMDKFDAFGREEVIYRGYRTAMLMPGLSPEQRRLLFGAALVGLAQPLPLGELFPTSPLPVPRS